MARVRIRREKCQETEALDATIRNDRFLDWQLFPFAYSLQDSYPPRMVFKRMSIALKIIANDRARSTHWAFPLSATTEKSLTRTREWWKLHPPPNVASSLTTFSKLAKDFPQEIEWTRLREKNRGCNPLMHSIPTMRREIRPENPERKSPLGSVIFRAYNDLKVSSGKLVNMNFCVCCLLRVSRWEV